MANALRNAAQAADVALPLLVDFSKKGVSDFQGSSDSFCGTVRIAADNADRVECIAEHLEQFFHEDGGGECLENHFQFDMRSHSAFRVMKIGECAFVRTTLELPDSLFREVKATAARQGMRRKDYVTEAQQDKLAKRPTHAEKPWMKFAGIAANDPEMVAELRRVVRLVELNLNRHGWSCERRVILVRTLKPLNPSPQGSFREPCEEGFSAYATDLTPEEAAAFQVVERYRQRADAEHVFDKIKNGSPRDDRREPENARAVTFL